MSGSVRLFVYGLLMKGEREHDLLERAEFIGDVRTAPIYTLVDLDFYPALLEGGNVAVIGELYAVDKQLRFAIDVKKQVPILFQRIVVRLEDGSDADAYAMRVEQVRGKRRLKHGSWRSRFAPRPRSGAGGAMAEYARNRFRKP